MHQPSLGPTSEAGMESVLILTPAKDAAHHLQSYFELLYSLDYPRRLLSLAFLEGDSTDDTFSRLEGRLPELRREFAGAGVWKRDYGFRVPHNANRWDYPLQVDRRAALARSRNYLLSRALRDEQWVLWLDVDIVDYPADILQRLIAAGRDVVQPNCVKEAGGKSFDLNAWRDHGSKYMHDLRSEGELVRLDSVGGSMLLVRADLHREGLVFPPFLYGVRNPRARRRHNFSSKGLINALRPGVCGEIETEGLAMMAYDMGYQCWGMPGLEIIHRDA
ncbi:MAG TPA: hypothetical protein VGD59_00310 [Acidisarcina sp.]